MAAVQGQNQQNNPFMDWANGAITSIGNLFSGGSQQNAPSSSSGLNNGSSGGGGGGGGGGATPSNPIPTNTGVYQGPVPNGANEQLFRQTGYTDVKPKTTSTSSGGNSGGGGQDLNALWRQTHPGEGDRPAGWNGDGGGNSQTDLMSQISEMYQPYLNSLNQMEQNINTGKQEDLANIDSQYANSQKKIQGQGDELYGNLDTQVRDLAGSFQSAVTDAIRSYNQLKQQSLSKYGMGSSLGQALQGLASQEFFRQQGNLYNQKIAGETTAKTEQVKIKRFVEEKISDLDTWKKDVTTKLDQSVRDRLAEINARRGDIESNKTRDKVNLLQQAYQQAQQVELLDRQYRQGLASYAVETLATQQEKNFDPTQIPKIVGDVMTAYIPGANSALGQATSQYLLNSKGQKVDEYGNLIQ